jgi:hypothetical protein
LTWLDLRRNQSFVLCAREERGECSSKCCSHPLCPAQTRFIYYLFRSFLVSIGALTKRLLAGKGQSLFSPEGYFVFTTIALGSRTLRCGAKKAIRAIFLVSLDVLAVRKNFRIACLRAIVK